MGRSRHDATGTHEALRSFVPDSVRATRARLYNVGTRIGLPAAEPAAPFAEVWRRIFPSLRPLEQSFRKDGLLAVAVHGNQRITDYLHLPLGDRPEFVTIGRHDRCDLVLRQDPTVSLRHAVLMADPAAGELRVRLLDLHSGSGFATEEGLPCESLSADGPLFVRLGAFHLLFLPTGGLAPLPWDGSAEEAWSAFPERIYRDCRAPQRAPAALRAVRGGDGGRGSVITSILEPPGPLRPPRQRPGELGARLGEIELRAGAGAERHALHEAELERGLLVGRYERCELGIADDTLSRVHLLLMRRGGAVWAVDTASSNGTTVGGAPMRQVRLAPEAELVLAQTIALRFWPTESA